MTTFSAAHADHAEAFFERCLVHTKGQWAGDSFKLADWEADRIIRPLFGELRDDGTRRYRTCFVAIPRKNGKSTVCAGVSLYLTCADGEAGAEVYSAAGDRGQARIVFDQASRMVESSLQLSSRLDVYRSSIYDRSSGSSYQVLSADASLKHGLNAHGIIFDELHVQPNRKLWDVLTTSTGARRQPVTLAITTAGHDRHSICWELWQHALAVQEGRVEDASLLVAIWAADAGADWLSEATWRACNPNLGESISLDYLREEAERARHMPGRENAFRQLHLNQWTEQAVRWLQLEAWDACAGELDYLDLRELERYAGRPCFAGLDLARTRDLSALVLYFPKTETEPAAVVPFFWCPEEDITTRSERDRAPYDLWVEQGLLEATPGNVTDFAFIERRVLELWDALDLREVAYDRAFAGELVTRLQEQGVLVVPFGQGFLSMAAPTSELERQILGSELVHGGHPILRWMAGNVAVRRDPAGNIKPDKERSTERIDGIVTLIMALGRASVHDGSGGPSVYETRGLVELDA